MFSFLLLSNDMKICTSFITSEGKKIHRNECDEDRFTRHVNANEKMEEEEEKKNTLTHAERNCLHS